MESLVRELLTNRLDPTPLGDKLFVIASVFCIPLISAEDPSLLKALLDGEPLKSVLDGEAAFARFKTFATAPEVLTLAYSFVDSLDAGSLQA